ncbi:PREDICTED: monocarboxylate transporter 14-like [Priapulus caudatus]|uniref:Monocarboxylate transporter 14-like n=1 Tax=Priapulus caudatus TaxID=37621 RepID=A0ABM1E874_PRICU|nr:PREDICTED: monocarboxylate transporter 14-like [Priapulus caudatus]
MGRLCALGLWNIIQYNVVSPQNAVMLRYSRDVDRGWAWVVVGSSFIAQSLMIGLTWSVGVFFVIFLEEFKQSSSSTAWISSINTAACMATGTGLGIAFIPCIVAVSEYFDTKRALAMGLAVSGMGFGILIYPILIQHLLQVFTWRQVMFITGALILNVIPCAAVIHPLVLHDDDASDNHKKLPSVSVFEKKFIRICANNLLIAFGLSVVYVHMPAYARSHGTNQEVAVMLISVNGVANFFGRIAYGFMAQYLRWTPEQFYNASFMTAGILTLLLPMCTQLYFMLLYCALIGFLSASWGALLPAILVDAIGKFRMASGYGFVMVYEAVGIMLGGPVAGWIYDYTGAYAISFYFAGLTFTVGVLVMWIPGFSGRCNPRKNKVYLSDISISAYNEHYLKKIGNEDQKPGLL